MSFYLSIYVYIVPEAVEDLIIQSKAESKVVFQWIPPDTPNGIILQYHISYGTLNSNITFNTTVTSDVRTFNIMALSKYDHCNCILAHIYIAICILNTSPTHTHIYIIGHTYL